MTNFALKSGAARAAPAAPLLTALNSEVAAQVYWTLCKWFNFCFANCGLFITMVTATEVSQLFHVMWRLCLLQCNSKLDFSQPI